MRSCVLGTAWQSFVWFVPYTPYRCRGMATSILLIVSVSLGPVAYAFNSFCIVLLVRNAIFMLVFLNRLVTYVVSLPI